MPLRSFKYFGQRFFLAAGLRRRSCCCCWIKAMLLENRTGRWQDGAPDFVVWNLLSIALVIGIELGPKGVEISLDDARHLPRSSFCWHRGCDCLTPWNCRCAV